MKQLSAILLAILFVFVCVSCNMFGEDENLNKPDSPIVNVKLSVSQTNTKALTPSYPNGVAEQYQYKAMPRSGDTTIQGTKTEWTNFTNNSSVGFFAEGMWIFEIRIICGNRTSYGILCSGTTTVTLTETSNTVSITLSNLPSSESYGEVFYKINVPLISDSKGEMKIFVDNSPVVPQTSNANISGSEIIFDGTLRCKSGFKEIKFEFWDKTVDSRVPISSDMIPVRIVENTTVIVSGSIQNVGTSNASFNITYMKLNVSVAGPTSIRVGSSSNGFSCFAEGGSNYVYQWYVNGVPQLLANRDTVGITISKKGIYTISCVVYCLDNGTKIYGSASTDVRVY